MNYIGPCTPVPTPRPLPQPVRLILAIAIPLFSNGDSTSVVERAKSMSFLFWKKRLISSEVNKSVGTFPGHPK